MKIKKYSKHILIFVILATAFFLRIYKFHEFYVFSHDQDLASWIIKDIVFNKHLRLIGQETSSQGVFIGSLFYYLQIPFYILGKMNPIFSVFLPIIIGVFSVWSCYFVVSKIINKKTGIIASFIYATSSLIVFIDREVVPTMPVMLWTVWYLYSLYIIRFGKILYGFILWGFLVGLIWHLNLALVILLPLVIIPLFFLPKKSYLKHLLLGIIIAVVLNLPFFIFESRHDFIQSRSIILSLTTNKDLIEGTSVGFAKFDRVMQLVTKNSISLFSERHFIRPVFFFWFLVFLFMFLVKNKKITNFLAIIFFFWQISYIIFFSSISLNVSEYYFNGMNIIWIIIASVWLLLLFSNKKFKLLGYLFLILFVLVNIYNILTRNIDKKGYIEKRMLVSEIKSDSQKNGYPCVSISYITKPGYDLGYRYLFWLEDMHVNNPSSNSPVYTIVYPHNMVNKIDKVFGSLGLIYPDYSRYNKTEVEISCKGDNSNLTDPMFGYTE